MAEPLQDLKITGRDGSAPTICRQLESCEIVRETSSPARCALSFLGDTVDELAAQFGSWLRVTLRGTSLFEGSVREIETNGRTNGERRLRILAADRLDELSSDLGAESFSAVSLSGLADLLAGRVGLTASFHGSRNPSWRHLVRYKETSLDLLRRCCETAGVGFCLQQDSLSLFDIGTGFGPLWHIAEEPQIFRISLRRDRTKERGACRVRGWASLRNQALIGLSGPDAGASEPPVDLVDAAVCDEEVADALARGRWERFDAWRESLSGRVSGTTIARPGLPVLFRGAPVPRTYSGVLHRASLRFASDQGFTTEFDTAPPPTAAHPAGFTLVQGRVVDIEDPEGRGRIRVIYPALGDVESDWLPVVLPGLGNGKGLSILPDVGDFVLVGYNVDNPAQGMLLGSMYGESDDASDSNLGRKRMTRYRIDTKGGSSLVLDDGPEGIQIKTPQGFSLVVGESSIRLQAADGTEIELRPSVVKIETGRFEVVADRVDFKKKRIGP